MRLFCKFTFVKYEAVHSTGIKWVSSPWGTVCETSRARHRDLGLKGQFRSSVCRVYVSECVSVSRFGN